MHPFLTLHTKFKRSPEKYNRYELRDEKPRIYPYVSYICNYLYSPRKISYLRSIISTVRLNIESQLTVKTNYSDIIEEDFASTQSRQNYVKKMYNVTLW